MVGGSRAGRTRLGCEFWLAIVESDASLAPFPVKTLIGGTVIAKHIALGEAVSRNRSAFVVADLSTVWIDLTVYQRDLQHIAVGQTVQVLTGHDAAPELAKIAYVTSVIAEETRTATARLVMANSDHFWRPGMFVTADVLIAEVAATVAVPLTALQDYEGGVVVFVSTDEGFVPQQVELGQRDSSMVEILSGLSLGEQYVSKGGFTSLLASFGALLQPATPDNIREAFARVSVKQMRTWVSTNLGTTVPSKRQSAYAESKTTA